MPIRETRKDTIFILEDSGTLIRAMTGILEKLLALCANLIPKPIYCRQLVRELHFYRYRWFKTSLVAVPFIISSIFSTLSVLVGLFAIHPSRYMRKNDSKKV